MEVRWHVQSIQLDNEELLGDTARLAPARIQGSLTNLCTDALGEFGQVRG